MEVFSLLKYWRSGGGGGVGETNSTSHSSHSRHSSLHATTTTTTTNTGSSSSVSSSTITTIREADGGDCGEESDHDEGPFFDLEFTVPEQECEEEDEEEEGESEDEFDFTVDSSCSTGNRTDPNLSLSPSDDLFFNGRFVPLEPTEFGSESSSKLQFPGSLLKPATKLRVLMLGFKKPKAEAKQSRAKASFTVKLKVEEDPVTILSLFSSSRNPAKDAVASDDGDRKFANKEAVAENSDEKKFAKDVLQKYLKMVKPLYFKVSKKSNGLSGQLNVSSSVLISKSEGEEVKEPPPPNSSNVRVLKEGNLTAGLRNVRKHLGKSRSASSAAVASVPAAAMAVQSRRHDDSLLQQQDGIQSAIMHCKRSFTASRDSDCLNQTSLSRCTSDPSHEKSKSITKPSRISLDETRVRN